MLFAGFVAILVNGFAAYLLGQPLLFPSLSPTVFTFFRQPLTQQASPRSAVRGCAHSFCKETVLHEATGYSQTSCKKHSPKLTCSWLLIQQRWGVLHGHGGGNSIRQIEASCGSRRRCRMSADVKDEGDYELFETTRGHRILVLNGERWFAWVEEQQGELLVHSGSVTML